MSLFAPGYYPYFACKGGACKHTCCRGWEIDIDPLTAAKYRTYPGKLGERMRSACASLDSDAAHFILDAEENCPFLRTDGLCALIRCKGEGFLPDICALHPRYRNDYAGRCEIGLGLCCEEAVLLVLSYRPCPIPVPIPPHARMVSEGKAPHIREVLLCHERNALLRRMYRQKDRVSALIALCPAAFALSPASYESLLSTMNRFDSAFEENLSRMRANTAPLSALMTRGHEAHLLRLFAAFINRYYPRIADEFDRCAVRTLAAVSPFLILSMARSNKNADFFDATRRFSTEIEYDEDNLARLISFFESFHVQRNPLC